MIVNSLWVGDCLTPIEQLAMRSFLAHGYEYHLYTYHPVSGVPEGVFVQDGNTILPHTEIFTYTAVAGAAQGSVAAFSNFFRYKLLLEHGGIWVDCDLVLVRPPDLSADYVFATERTEAGKTNVATCFIKTPPDTELIRFCWHRCQATNKATLGWTQVGPRLMTEAVQKLGLGSFCVEPEAFCPVDWWMLEQQILGTEAGGALPGGAYGVHLWNELWRRKRIDKSQSPQPGSVLAALFARYPAGASS